MPKRRHSFDTRQLALDLNLGPKSERDGALFGLDFRISSAVGAILKDEPRDRWAVAAEMSRLLDDEVTKGMLDKYSSETSGTHNISAGRFMALVLATGRFDVLREFMGEIDVDIVIGKEALTLRLGNIAAQQKRLAEEAASIRKLAPEIGRLSRNGGRK